MKALISACILCVAACQLANGQQAQRVFTSDITHFWIAFDSAGTTTDTLEQQRMFQQLYVDKGSEGLRAFMAARNYDAHMWASLARRYPKFWKSIRPNTISAGIYARAIEQRIEKLRRLYPDLKDARMYFTIGGLRSAGTTTSDMVLIGAEMAMATPRTDVSEFSSRWLADVFATQKADDIVQLNIHEYVHTQQRGEPKNLLAQAIMEGSCDFIAELVMERPLQSAYAVYGRKNELQLKMDFKAVMYTEAYQDWLYNGGDAATVADLGYYMGYAICKAYYRRATDKRKAVREIIGLDYSSEDAVNSFVARSAYF